MSDAENDTNTFMREVNPCDLTIDGHLGYGLGCSHVAGVNIRVSLLQLFDGQSHDLLLLGHLVSASILQLSVTFEPCHSGWSLCSLTQQGYRRRLVCLAVLQYFNKFMAWFCKNQRICTTDMTFFKIGIRAAKDSYL